MLKKWKKFLPALAALIVVFSLGTAVMADDHDDGGGDVKHEYFQKGDDEKGNSNSQNQTSMSQKKEYWNIWSREPVNNPGNPLPINLPGELKLSVNNVVSSSYFIPQDGQLLVSAQEIASVLGAKAAFYPQSNISVLTKGSRELIVRAGSNAVYEERIKAPMPVKAVFYENSVYIPISVAANGLGFRIVWDSAKQTIILQSI